MRAFLVVLLLGGCVGTDVDAAQEDLSLSDVARFARGRDLFLNATLGGNGRTCGSCHLRDGASDNNFDFTPADAEAIFTADPGNPLFRALDSDDGAGADYTMLRTRGLVHIPFVLPPTVTVASGASSVFVLRSTPSIENTALIPTKMWDGRFATLPPQANGAVETHFETATRLTPQEAADISFFQERFFTNAQLRLYAAGGPAPTLPAVPGWLQGASADSARRGRNFFVTMPIVDGAAVRGGHCATCHSGPMLSTTNAFNPVQPANEGVSNNFVADVSPLPPQTYTITLDHWVTMPDVPTAPIFGIPPGTPLFPPGTPFTITMHDPGRPLTTGDPCELALGCLIGTGTFGFPTTFSVFRISSLWGAADTAPYMHDNSLETLEDVVAHYQNFVFEGTAAATGVEAWNLSARDQSDIVAYMRFGLRRTTPL